MKELVQQISWNRGHLETINILEIKRNRNLRRIRPRDKRKNQTPRKKGKK